ncbi:MAG TPA: gfo/Idh/MocA family oxidoreductase [Candidatus Hydrogenedentes bacterium]|nr:gfo/Idh/MocA family oxidoreductase [Candidatus Hydrogenedentota bacterium]
MKKNMLVMFGVLLGGTLAASEEAPLKLGMIGLDTSHVIAFTKVLHDTDDPNHVPGGRVIAAYKGGSPDLESSASRVDGYTDQMQKEFGVQIVDTIEELCGMVDAVLLMSVDGRPHLGQVKPVFEAGKRVYIDKPLAGSLEDAIAIMELGKEHNVPWFSSSSYRYYDSLQKLKATDVGDVRGAISYGPCHLEPTHPDLFWYGIHPTEALYTIMGTGCEAVTCAVTEQFHVVTGVWEGGRVGTLYGLRTGATPHRVTVFGTKAVADQEGGGNYAPLVAEIITFFRTGEPPVRPEETLEMFAFMEAAHESVRRNGAPVRLQEVLPK